MAAVTKVALILTIYCLIDLSREPRYSVSMSHYPAGDSGHLIRGKPIVVADRRAGVVAQNDDPARTCERGIWTDSSFAPSVAFRNALFARFLVH